MKKSQIKAPELPAKTVDVPELGGEVVVKGMLLKERIEYAREFAKEKPDDPDRFDHIAELLARSVRDEDGECIFTAAEWELFGASNYLAAMRIWSVAQDMCGFGGREETEKKSESQTPD